MAGIFGFLGLVAALFGLHQARRPSTPISVKPIECAPKVERRRK